MVWECLGDADTSGFRLLDVIETTTGSSATGSHTVRTPWSDLNQVVPFGGWHGGGAYGFLDASKVSPPPRSEA